MVFFYDVETYRGLASLAPSSLSYPAQWQSFVEDTKVLYFKNSYKRCAGQCQRMLHEQQHELHPIHETFLHFYIAICNESLGLAAHKYSSKKLSFLHLAKDAFAAALVSLPLPFATDESGDYDAFRTTPGSLDIHHIRGHNDRESNMSYLTQLDLFSSTSDTKNSTHEHCDSGYDSESEASPVCIDNVPDFSSYSARQPLGGSAPHDLSAVKMSPHAGQFENTDLKTNHLMPKPLFVKKRTSELKQSSAPRPFPLPLHPPKLGQRKTAIHQPPPQNKKLAPPAPPPNPSPTITSCPTVQTRLQPSSSTTALTRYNTNLTTFHSLLTTHLLSISTTIITTTDLQHSHRLNQSNRIASFWTFQPITIINPPHTAAAAAAADKAIVDEGVDGTAAKEKKKRAARMARLRTAGWRVNKERHGWKGEAYYEELRGTALAELGIERREWIR